MLANYLEFCLDEGLRNAYNSGTKYSLPKLYYMDKNERKREWHIKIYFDEPVQYVKKYGLVNGKETTSQPIEITGNSSRNTVQSAIVKISAEYTKKIRQGATAKPRLVELRNGGNRCYVNSLTQCLVFTECRMPKEMLSCFMEGNMKPFAQERGYHDPSELLRNLNIPNVTFIEKFCDGEYSLENSLDINDDCLAVSFNVSLGEGSYSEKEVIDASYNLYVTIPCTLNNGLYKLTSFIRFIKPKHYIAYVKYDFEEENTWYKIDDISEMECLELTTTEDIRRKGMRMCFYKKVSIHNQIQPMLAKVYTEQVKLGEEYYVQTKFNGVRTLVTRNSIIEYYSKVMLPKDYSFFDWEIGQVFDAFAEMNLTNIYLDCEVYKHGSSLQKINSMLSRKIPDTTGLKLHIFTFFSTDVKFTMDERVEIIKRINSELHLTNITFVDSVKLVMKHGLDMIDDYLESNITMGFEGIMLYVANGFYEYERTSNLLKYKRFYDIEAVVLDIDEGIGKMKDKAIFTMKSKFLIDSNGERIDIQIQFDTNAAFDHEFLTEIFSNRKQYIGRIATVKYTGLSNENVPLHSNLVDFTEEYDEENEEEHSSNEIDKIAEEIYGSQEAD